MLTIDYRHIEELTPHPDNPRDISNVEFKVLCESIKANPVYFEARPLLLSDRTGINIIIAGNKRFEAAKENGLTKVPTILIPNLTEAQEREYMLRDNINNGTWNEDELQKFQDVGFKRIGLHLEQVKIQNRDNIGSDSAYDEEQLKPFEMTHVLISIPVKSFIDAVPHLEKLKAIKGVIYEQGSN